MYESEEEFFWTDLPACYQHTRYPINLLPDVRQEYLKVQNYNHQYQFQVIQIVESQF